MLNIEWLIARQSSITFFLIHPVQCKEKQRKNEGEKNTLKVKEKKGKTER